ncbi:MAG: sulfur carrier protein ThiS [Acidobacteriota bacterium]|nr:sulfur carrier protein ThiS [Acidobacteriota bacterium]
MSSPDSIQLNGRPHPVAPGSTLLTLLAELGRDPRAVAIEYNGEIVRRPRYGEVQLVAGDQVEVVHFVQGG